MQATLESFLKLPSNWSVSPLFFSICLSLSVPIYLCLSLSHLRSLSGISSVSRPLSQLLYLTPLQGARCTFQRSLWWICLNEGTQPSARVNAPPAHQECVKCWPSSHGGVQNTVMLICCHPMWFWRTLFWQPNRLHSSYTQWKKTVLPELLQSLQLQIRSLLSQLVHDY